MKLGRRGYGGAGGAAVLILLIALLIILYILFLPPAQRAAILGEPVSGPGSGPGVDDSVLLSIVPNQVTNTNSVTARSLPSFTVRTRTSGNILAQRDAMTVERSVFHKESDIISFVRPADANNVLLSFTSLVAEGELKIWLNGQVIFDNPLLQRQPPPILLKNEWLLSTNELIFEVSSPGFNFWQTNSVALVNVKVTADVTERQEASQEQSFVLRDLARQERVVLEFIAECPKPAGRLLLDLNGQSFYRGVPECNNPISLDVPFARISEGENTLRWDVEEGEYYLTSIQVLTEGIPVESDNTFQISPELQSAIISQGKEVHLSLSFRGANARGIVVVNGNELGFRTRQQSFAAPISQFVRSGSNTIVIADSTEDVTLLEVFVR